MSYTNNIIKIIKDKYHYQPEYVQAIVEVLESTSIIFDNNEYYQSISILERLVEPERLISFKVVWIDDQGNTKVNKGYRVQYNSSLGPYKGGLRFHPSVNDSIIKFLGFEQIFKNALTTLPLGGAKGGSDFDPKDKSDNEIRRFCQSFILELYKYIGPNLDIPAGDIGVGSKEIGYLYGYYKRIKNISEQGAITGKGIGYGGSLVRKEATGYGLIYFFISIAKYHNINYDNENIIISGSGNVAIYAGYKAQSYNMKVIKMSDSKGYIIDDNINMDIVKHIKEDLKGSLSLYPNLANSGTYHTGSVYDIDNDVKFIFLCGTQNEIDKTKALRLLKNKPLIISEGANMPSDNDAIKIYKDNNIILAPAKAANAGGVATSGLEMVQNANKLYWSYQQVDQELNNIMNNIFNQCRDTIKEYNLNDIDYLKAANIAGVKKVIDAMIAMGDY